MNSAEIFSSGAKGAQRQETVEVGQPWAGELISLSVVDPFGKALTPESHLPSCPPAWLPGVVGPSRLCRVRNEASVSQTLGSRAGVAMIIGHQLCLQSKIRSLPLFLTPLPYPSHNAPICPSHVIFVFSSAILFAQCFFSPTCLFFFWLLHSG